MQNHPRHLHVHIAPLPSRAAFLARLALGIARGAALLGIALGLGILGYRYLVGLSWLDALLNAAMILGGEGPIAPTPTPAGKIFASFFALFSGLVFVTITGLVIGPAAQRLLHRFHLEAIVPVDPSAEEATLGSGRAPGTPQSPA